MKKYNHGFVLGKFMPLHAGHVFLLETAEAQCEKLTILVFTEPNDPIPGDIRLHWVRQQFPGADIVHHAKPLPRDASQTAFWDVWRKSIEEHCEGRIFEAVFSSEAYGQRLAKDLKAEHVAVDLDRIKYPVSGTDIRNDPGAYVEFIPEIVRTYYRDQLGRAVTSKGTAK